MIKAKLSHLRISPRKVRLIANLIKGLPVIEAEKQLKFLAKKSAVPILKLLNSAAANAKNNNSLSKDNLFVSNIIIDAGPSLKRWMPRAMGRATPILKRTSHITVILEEKEGLAADKIKDVKPKAEKEIKSVVKDEKEKTLLEEISQPEKQKLDIEEKKSSDKEIKSVPPKKPYSTTSQSKKKFFSRQTFGNAKKMFRRKSI